MGKKGKKDKVEEVVEEGEKWVKPEFHEDPVLWITLELFLKDWKFMDSSMRVKTSTQVFSIKKQLADRHGRIKDLVLCKEAFEPSKELKDDMKTLEECGIMGTPDEQGIVQVTPATSAESPA